MMFTPRMDQLLSRLAENDFDVVLTTNDDTFSGLDQALLAKMSRQREQSDAAHNTLSMVG